MGIWDFFRGSPAERVARQFMKALRDAGVTHRLEYEADDNQIGFYDENGSRVRVSFLGNLRRELEAAAADSHADIYRRYALSMQDLAGDSTPSYALAKPRLRILLKSDRYPDYIALHNRVELPDATSPQLVFEPLVGDVIACCIEASDDSLRFVTESDLVTWQVDAATALADARANVCSLPFAVNESQSWRYVFNDDSYKAARLVNPRMFDGLPVRGNWVAIVPDRDTFFLAASDDVDKVAGLARLAQAQLEKGERIISAIPFVLRDRHWHVYEPPQEIRPLFTNVALQYRAADWNAYKALLEKELAAGGQGIIVAEMTIVQSEDVEARFSAAIWRKSVVTILPRVDTVFFFESESEPVRAAVWENVVRVMGSGMEREPGLPERYRVGAFPNAEQMVAMGTQAMS